MSRAAAPQGCTAAGSQIPRHRRELPQHECDERRYALQMPRYGLCAALGQAHQVARAPLLHGAHEGNESHDAAHAPHDKAGEVQK